MVAPIDTAEDSDIGLPLEDSSKIKAETTKHALNELNNHLDEASSADDDSDRSMRRLNFEPSPIPNITSPSEDGNTQSLEERVQELETKLATLSLLLHQQRRLRSRSISPNVTPYQSDDDDNDDSSRNTTIPALDSPAPPQLSTRRKRNLSFRVLYQDGDESPRDPKDDDSNCIFLPKSLGDNVDDEKPKKSHDSHPLKKLSTIASATSLEKATMNVSPDDYSTRSDSASSIALAEEKDEATKLKGKWFDYLNSFQESNYDTDKQMEEFVKVPSAVEGLLNFGFWICVDSFLYVLTILPIRFVWSCVLLLRYVLYRTWRSEVPDGPFRFHRRHSYQLLQVSIIYIIYTYALLPISIGKLYHWIRGQAMLKLYVLIAMVEVFDRLMCSLGQDCLDSLYWNMTRRPRSSRMVVSVVVVLVYAMVHSFLLFVHVATLNVAMNSADQALLSLLIGGNFAEIKSTVFKKYNKPSLFKIAASDICERFKLALFLGLVFFLNMTQGMNEKMVLSYIQMCGIVWCAEWLSDWIKHSFITKFNFISSQIYPEYALLLAGDVTGIGHEGVNLDHSHAVVRRIGLAQIPLVCVMFRYLREAVKYAGFWETAPPTWMLSLGAIGVWCLLLATKLALGAFLQKTCRDKLRAAPEFSSLRATVAKKNN